MALIIEDGSAKVDSEAYASVAEADTYFAVRDASQAAIWTALDTAEKEVALRLGAEYLDLQYKGRWKGRRVNEQQALDWPRFSVIDEDGFAVDSNEIREELKRANFEAGIRTSVEADDLIPDRDSGSIQRESVGVGRGAVKEDITYASPQEQVQRRTKLDQLLRGLLKVVGASGSIIMQRG